MLAKSPRKQCNVKSRDESRWAAVVSRDQQHDGKFYYSVATTGVFCRPSCPSRQPKRENVRFHETAEAAEAAGFRACKRCKPNQPGNGKRISGLVADACRLIESAESHVSLRELARRAELSPYHFHRLFKSVTGVTPKGYAAALRQKRIRSDLPKSKNVTDALYGAGFSSNSRFYETSSKVLGMTPTRYKSGGKGAVIRFAVGTCALGAVLVAESDQGVCAVLLGDEPDDLLNDLQDRFPKAELIGGDKAFDKRSAKVIAAVDDPRQKLDLPLDIRGTAFQHRVWKALLEIPAGCTASYTDIAKKIGRPKSVRAVASACGANPIAVIVPCHRVVRNDGALSGYRWGLVRKANLLKREKIR